MQYRDLIPDRQGGQFIASHIRIPQGGPVGDNVHHHDIRLQLIYCYRGWVRLVYEDQGDPFVMHAGDCILQPPHSCHRVLKSSDGLEVIELGSLAEHMTYLDHDMTLPTGRERPARDFNGPRFMFHQAATAPWQGDPENDWPCAISALARQRVGWPARASYAGHQATVHPSPRHSKTRSSLSPSYLRAA